MWNPIKCNLILQCFVISLSGTQHRSTQKGKRRLDNKKQDPVLVRNNIYIYRIFNVNRPCYSPCSVTLLQCMSKLLNKIRIVYKISIMKILHVTINFKCYRKEDLNYTYNVLHKVIQDAKNLHMPSLFPSLPYLSYSLPPATLPLSMFIPVPIYVYAYFKNITKTFTLDTLNKLYDSRLPLSHCLLSNFAGADTNRFSSQCEIYIL